MTNRRQLLPAGPASLPTARPVIAPLAAGDARAQAPATPALCVDRAGIAALLGISPRQVSRLQDAGKLPAPLELGTCKRWAVEEIEAWVRAGCPSRQAWQNLRSAVAAPRTREAGLH